MPTGPSGSLLKWIYINGVDNTTPYTHTHPNKLSLQSQWPILHIQHGSHLHTGYLRQFTTLLRVGTWGQLIFQGGFVDQSIQWDTCLFLNQHTSKWALWQTYCVYRAFWYQLIANSVCHPRIPAESRMAWVHQWLNTCFNWPLELYLTPTILKVPFLNSVRWSRVIFGAAVWNHAILPIRKVYCLLTVYTKNTFNSILFIILMAKHHFLTT